jgi:hypothetical protein
MPASVTVALPIFFRSVWDRRRIRAPDLASNLCVRLLRKRFGAMHEFAQMSDKPAAIAMLSGAAGYQFT